MKECGLAVKDRMGGQMKKRKRGPESGRDRRGALRVGATPRRFDLTSFDKLVVVYQAVICLLVLVGNVPGPRWAYLAAHGLFTIGLFALIALERRASNPVLKFVRYNYPLIFITFFYMETGRLVHAFFPWTLDGFLWDLDRIFFGGGPALWEAQILSPPARWMTEFFHAGYSFFYFLMPIAAVALWFRGPRGRHADFMFSLLLTYFIHYLLFIFLPAHSPRLYDTRLLEPLPGYFWSDLLKATMKQVAYPGGSFPSSHVAASIICGMAWKALGKWRFPVLFMTMVMFAGTVYGRYHYVTDIVIGTAAGLLLYRWAPRLQRGWFRPAGR